MRVKTGSVRRRKHKKWLRRAKGYLSSRKSTVRQAKQAVIRAGQHSFAHRKRKKADFRRLWIIRINGALRGSGFSYSRFMNSLKEQNINLNRKSLACLASEYPQEFKRLVKKIADKKQRQGK